LLLLLLLLFLVLLLLLMLVIVAAPQVQTLIELRAIHLEERGKMSRYGPLIGLEVLK
jgi:hypothetical protein